MINIVLCFLHFFNLIWKNFGSWLKKKKLGNACAQVRFPAEKERLGVKAFLTKANQGFKHRPRWPLTLILVDFLPTVSSIELNCHPHLCHSPVCVDPVTMGSASEYNCHVLYTPCKGCCRKIHFATWPWVHTEKYPALCRSTGMWIYAYN